MFIVGFGASILAANVGHLAYNFTDCRLGGLVWWTCWGISVFFGLFCGLAAARLLIAAGVALGRTARRSDAAKRETLDALKYEVLMPAATGSVAPRRP